MWSVDTDVSSDVYFWDLEESRWFIFPLNMMIVLCWSRRHRHNKSCSNYQYFLKICSSLRHEGDIFSLFVDDLSWSDSLIYYWIDSRELNSYYFVCNTDRLRRSEYDDRYWKVYAIGLKLDDMCGPRGIFISRVLRVVLCKFRRVILMIRLWRLEQQSIAMTLSAVIYHTTDKVVIYDDDGGAAALHST